MFQRPQHLMTRCARDRRVFYLEEPIYDPGGGTPRLEIRKGPVTVIVPRLRERAAPEAEACTLRDLLDDFLLRESVDDFVAWYYTPMALAFSEHLRPAATIYDCMDELSAFKGAPAILKEQEARLLRRADLVLTGGQSLFEAKRHQHANIHAMPSSVDAAHFAQARHATADPADQQDIPHPRLGFFGVIDERMDLALLDGVAAARPDWHIVMLGPVVKIDPATLPQRPNIHYLGSRSYDDLPRYIAGWDVAILPFARNEATRFISPTKTPEYMAAGRAVVSTSIRDVVRPYGQQGLVRIADDPAAFVDGCEAVMTEDPIARRQQADAFLRQTSWDGTWRRIQALMDDLADRRGLDATTTISGINRAAV